MKINKNTLVKMMLVVACTTLVNSSHAMLRWCTAQVSGLSKSAVAGMLIGAATIGTVHAHPVNAASTLKNCFDKEFETRLKNKRSVSSEYNLYPNYPDESIIAKVIAKRDIDPQDPQDIRLSKDDVEAFKKCLMTIPELEKYNYRFSYGYNGRSQEEKIEITLANITTKIDELYS